MQEIYFVTTNQHKLNEANKIFAASNFIIRPCNISIPEIQSDDQYEIVKYKSDYVAKQLNQPFFVDDTGIFFNFYKNFPGTYTKQIVNLIGLDGVFKLISNGHPAYFRTIILFNNMGKETIYEGIVRGNVSTTLPEFVDPKAPFNSVFIPEGQQKPLCELPNPEKFSHRGLALLQMMNELKCREESDVIRI